MQTKEILKQILLNSADAIDKGNSNYSEDQLNVLLDIARELTDDKLSKYQACKFLNISRATFDNYVKSGKIPEGRRQIGFKEKFWLRKDLQNVNKN